MSTKLASCPTHGRDHLVNAGAPNVVRCIPAAGCSTGVLERCLGCGGSGVAVVDERWGMKTVKTSRPCEGCEGRGWRSRRGSLGTYYPVS